MSNSIARAVRRAFKSELNRQHQSNLIRGAYARYERVQSIDQRIACYLRAAEREANAALDAAAQMAAKLMHTTDVDQLAKVIKRAGITLIGGTPTLH